MNHRFTCLKAALAVGSAWLLTPLVSLNAAEEAKPKPSIIFVLFDDLGYGQPKCYREGTEFKTPNLDKFAQEGMRFTDANSAASVCTPTRYGVITGRYPSRIGQYGVLTTFSEPIIPKTRLTVASMMKQNSYDTACLGKWHLGMDWGGKPGNEKTIPVGTQLRASPNAAGFDYFYGYTHARNIGTVIEQDKVEANVEEVESQPRLAKKVMGFLDSPARKEKPFFLYLPLCPPHTPIVPAPEFRAKSGTQGKEGQYGDWMYEGDWGLGQVLEALERNKLADNKRELHNLQTDLSEKNNVAEANPDVVDRLATLMKKYISEGRSPVGAAQKNEAQMSVDESSGGKKKKGKKAKQESDKEVALALAPNFD